MPIYRGPDGKIIEERTRRIQDGEQTDVKSSSFETPTKKPKADAAVKDEATDKSGDATKKIGKGKVKAEARKSKSTDDEKTELFSREADDGLDEDVGNEPVVAWLAVIEGPGTGNVLSCSYGTNSIGRGAGAKVNLDYGDKQISRKEHAILTYDPRGRKFYIQHGSGGGLTYLGDDPVLVPTVIEGRAEISVGDTRLMFVPLCGESFDWNDIKDASKK